MFSCESFGVTISLVVVLLCALYGYFKHAFNCWTRKDVASPPTSFPFGNVKDVILRKQNFTDLLGEFYTLARSKKLRYLGLYFFTRKALLVADPEMVKTVMNTEFQHFADRTLTYDEKNDPLTAHLVALNGNKWKRLRAKLTPTFSSGKLKAMFETVLECGDELVSVLRKQCHEPVEVKDVNSRYTTDVIGSCAFGIKCNSLENPNAEFREAGKRIFQSRPVNGIKFTILRNFPWLFKVLRLKQIDTEVTEFFIKAVRDTIQFRKDNNTTRKDFLQLCMALMESKDEVSNEDKNEDALLTLNEVAAQAFVFFLAGFETSATTVTFALFELVMNQDMQKALREEVNQVIDKHNGKITYDGIIEMQYMDKVVSETLRKYPPFTLMVRKCTKPYSIPQTNTIIDKGTSIIIPIYGLHHDPEFYPDPEKFDPHRFDSEAVKMRNDFTYIPWGSGPRICIGMRFALIEVKIALALLLKNFEFTLNEKTKLPLEKDKKTFLLNTVGGIWLNLKEIQN